MLRESWYGQNGNQLKCPFPGCSHVGSIITKMHCRIAHDMEREKIGELYGMPENVPKKIIDWEKLRG